MGIAIILQLGHINTHYTLWRAWVHGSLVPKLTRATNTNQPGNKARYVANTGIVEMFVGFN